MSENPAAPRIVLHVGCGAPDPRKLPQNHFPRAQWRELRLDLDPAVRPDILASITDMAGVDTGSMDAVWSSHNIEHLYPHEAPLALAEFRRVLKPGGFALLVTPDLRQVAELVAQDRLDDPAYVSPAGPIAPIDMLYGFRPSLAAGNHFMAHRGGFTEKTITAALRAAGFAEVKTYRDGRFGLWAMGSA